MYEDDLDEAVPAPDEELEDDPTYVFVIVDKYDPPTVYKFSKERLANVFIELFEGTDIEDVGILEGFQNGERALGDMLLQAF